MVLVVHKGINYAPDEDLTLAKVSSDSLHQSCLLARDGQSEYGGGGYGGYSVGGIPSFLSHPRSGIKDTPCLLDGLLAEEMLMNEGLQGFLLPPDLKNFIRSQKHHYF